MEIIIGVMTVIINILIAKYNVGKNRIIYDVEEIRVDRTLPNYLEELRNKLKKSEYTILNVFQDNVHKTSLYTIGKVKK